MRPATKILSWPGAKFDVLVNGDGKRLYFVNFVPVIILLTVSGLVGIHSPVAECILMNLAMQDNWIYVWITNRSLRQRPFDFQDRYECLRTRMMCGTSISVASQLVLTVYGLPVKTKKAYKEF